MEDLEKEFQEAEGAACSQACRRSGESSNDSGEGRLGCSVGSSEPPWAVLSLESHGVPSARADSAAQDGEQHAVWRA